MNNRFLTILTLITSSTLFMVGCSDTDAFNNTAATDAASNEVQTQVPDQDSLTLSVEKIAVEALDFNGEAVTVTVYVADRNNNPVPDNTAIKFLTNGGAVEPQCLTTGGACSVIWTEQDPTPGVDGVPGNFEAIILAYTTGEESFTDSNDNGLYDAGEPWTDITEPFFDTNDDGERDPIIDEFVDADNDNTFDIADGLFTGTPCIGDNTVCNRVSTLIWDRTDIVLSDSSAAITWLSGAFPGTVNTAANFTFQITDVNGKFMADGTTIIASTTGGTIAPSTITLAPGQTEISLKYISGDPVGGDSITIEVKSPSGLITSGTI